jgi:hypothetical protein
VIQKNAIFILSKYSGNSSHLNSEHFTVDIIRLDKIYLTLSTACSGQADPDELAITTTSLAQGTRDSRFPVLED